MHILLIGADGVIGRGLWVYALGELLIVYALYGLAFVAWVPVAWLQHRIRDLAAQSATKGQPLCSKCLAYYRLWFALGWPAFIALMGIFWLMITRPPI